VISDSVYSPGKFAGTGAENKYRQRRPLQRWSQVTQYICFLFLAVNIYDCSLLITVRCRQLPLQTSYQDGSPAMHSTSLGRHPSLLLLPQHGCIIPCVNWPL